MIGIVGQTAIVDPRHLVVLAQPLGDALCILAVALHAQVQGFQPEVEQESIHRSLYRTEVAHHLCRGLGDIGHLAEALRVGEPVVRGVGRCQSGELLRMGLPVKVTAIHNDTTHSCSVPVHVLGGRVGHDVGPPLEGAAVDGGGEGVVHDEGHAVAVGDTGKLLNVEHLAAGVRDGLAEEALRVGTEGLLYLLLRSVLVDEGHVDAELLHRHAEEVVCAAIDSR